MAIAFYKHTSDLYDEGKCDSDWIICNQIFQKSSKLLLDQAFQKYWDSIKLLKSHCESSENLDENIEDSELEF
jgi:hypothetical protein